MREYATRFARYIWPAFVLMAVLAMAHRLDERNAARAAPVRLWPEASVVEVAVWPDSVEIEVGDSVQFYAAARMSDGSVECTDATAELHAAPWTNAEGCESAAALLAPYEAQDTPFVRFSWDTIPSASYDSLFYHVLLRSGADTTQMIDDLRLAHPAATLDWHNGVPNTSYQVAAYAETWKFYMGVDSMWTGERGPWTTFGYPEPYPVPVEMGDVRVDTVSGGV